MGDNLMLFFNFLGISSIRGRSKTILDRLEKAILHIFLLKGSIMTKMSVLQRVMMTKSSFVHNDKTLWWDLSCLNLSS